MNDLPSPGDAELHVFGPGYGESLLVHLGLGDWMIVDSCRERGMPPAPLRWLSSVGVDPENAVKLVVATHWHDDHVRGLAETLAACKNAEFVCSSALLSEELVMLAFDAARSGLRSSSGFDELRGVIAELRRRNAEGGERVLGSGREFAMADRRLFLRSTAPACQIWSLSPSSAEQELSLKQFAAIAAGQAEGAARRRPASVEPNHSAVVLWVSVGERVLLLGADLEERRSTPKGSAVSNAGWTAILASTKRPQEPAEVFKVAHHGSATAHNDAVWTELLGSDPVAVLTPFERGSVRLPSKSDCQRILERTSMAYSSAQRRGQRYKPADKVVSWAVQGKRASTPIPMGHVQMRASALEMGQDWRVTLRGNACELSKLAT